MHVHHDQSLNMEFKFFVLLLLKLIEKKIIGNKLKQINFKTKKNEAITI